MAAEVCGAKNRQGGECGQMAMANGRCRFHGGLSLPPGADHPSFKDGRYSKAIPARLRERIMRADGDPDVLSHRRDLSLLDARMEELLERLTDGGSARAWRLLGETVDALLAAREAGDQTALAGALSELVRQVKVGVDEERCWADLIRVMRERRDTATAEHKRTLELSTAIRPDELGAMIARIALLIRREVADESVRRKIALELEAMSNAPEQLH